MLGAVHRPVPNLRVSPSRSPSWLASKSSPLWTTARCGDREETTNIYLFVRYTEREDAGSTLATGLNGPKSGVHFNGGLNDALSPGTPEVRTSERHAPYSFWIATSSHGGQSELT